MKLVTFMSQGAVRVGALISRGGLPWVLDLNRAQPHLPPGMTAFLEVGEAAMQAAQAAISTIHDSPTHAEPALLPESEVHLLAPVPRPGKIICLGHNYHDHSGGTLPDYPTFFSKYANTVIGPGHPVVIPRLSQQVDNEAELACVIGKRARHIAQDQALGCVAGYTIFNDVSARDYQKRSSQWMMGKTFDTFGPMGPALVTRDEIADPGALEIMLTVDGLEVQHSNTRNFIFSIPFLIAYLSQVMTLEPGDLISTGTPARVGNFRDNPRFMKPGDEARIRIEKIGELANPFVAESQPGQD
jgi:acylpyruvate hydrolase